MKNNVIKYSKLEEVSNNESIHVGVNLYPLNPIRILERIKLTHSGVREFIKINEKFKCRVDIFTVHCGREIPRITYCEDSGDMLVRNFLLGGIQDIPRTAIGILKEFGRNREIAFLTTLTVYSSGKGGTRYQLFIVE